MRAIETLAMIVTLLCVPAAHGQGAVPLGGEFQVNTYTTSNQTLPVISHQDDGGFVVVWQSQEPTDSDDIESNVRGQRYAAGGTPMGGQFQVNTYVPGGQGAPAVATLAGGGFVVVWHSLGSNSPDTGFSIQGRLYAADGMAVGGEFLVNSYLPGPQAYPEVAAFADGGFVVAWRGHGSNGSDSSGRSVHAQRYRASGMPEGEELQVNTYTTGDQASAAVAALADGGFVATWTSTVSSSGTTTYSVHGQRYAADGTAAGEELQVDSELFSYGTSAVVGLADGGFMALWSTAGRGHPLADIQGQRYGANGSATGDRFRVNSFTPDAQVLPSVSPLANGGFAVAWQSEGSTGTDQSFEAIQARRYTAGGIPLGGEFQVNTYTGFNQRDAAVSGSPDGGLVAAWTSADSGPSGSDTSGSSIQGQRYAAPRFSLTSLGGECLDVENADPSSGTPVNLDTCHGDDNQRWRLDLGAVPQRVIGLGDQCLIPGPDDGLVIGECGAGDDLWRLATPGHAEPSLLVHLESGLCFDGATAEDGSGTPATLSECHGGAGQSWRPAAEVCTRDSLGLCLETGRFRVDLAWRSFDGTSGSGQAVPFGSDDSGLLWFFEADNWEMLIKVLDGCDVNDRLWVFAAATTTVEYNLTVTDTATGTIREYFNPLGDAAAAITDTDAFATCAAAAEPAAQPALKTGPIPPGGQAKALLEGSCVPSPTRMCLSGGRFSVEVEWVDYAGNTGSGQVVGGTDSPFPGTGTSNTSGLLWFFEPDNWEMLVKVLDACEINDQFLFLGAATTDVEYTLTVRDVEADVVWQHTNPLGQASEALVHWFDTCP